MARSETALPAVRTSEDMTTEHFEALSAMAAASNQEIEEFLSVGALRAKTLSDAKAAQKVLRSRLARLQVAPPDLLAALDAVALPADKFEDELLQKPLRLLAPLVSRGPQGVQRQ